VFLPPRCPNRACRHGQVGRRVVVQLLQGDHPADEDNACPGAGDGAAGLSAGGDPCVARGLGVTEVFRPARSSGIF